MSRSRGKREAPAPGLGPFRPQVGVGSQPDEYWLCSGSGCRGNAQYENTIRYRRTRRGSQQFLRKWRTKRCAVRGSELKRFIGTPGQAKLWIRGRTKV